MANLKNIFNRLNTGKWSSVKKIVIGIAGVVMLIIMSIMLFQIESSEPPIADGVQIMPGRQKPKKDLNYDFIGVDTFKIHNFPQSDKRRIVQPPPNSEPNTTIRKPPRQTPPARRTPAPTTTTPRSTVPRVSGNINKNPNMIVMNNMAENPVKSSQSTGAGIFNGNQATLIKVVLPSRTPVANGSLVEARVIRDSKWGNTVIPKRTKIIGVANLFNRRVHIDCREIILNDRSRSCSGRAYDIKRLEGLPYSPVSTEARRILIDELRDATAGVPVVGRVTNRVQSNNYLNQTVAQLEEGIEFYVMLNSVY